MVLSPHSLAKMATSIGFWGCFLSKRMDFPPIVLLDCYMIPWRPPRRTRASCKVPYLRTYLEQYPESCQLPIGNKKFEFIWRTKIWIHENHLNHPYPLFQSIGFCRKKQEFNLGIGLEEPRGEGDSSFISAVSRESQGGRLLAEIEGCPRFLGGWEIRSTMDQWC